MKIKLDENLPTRLGYFLASQNHQVDTVADEGLTGKPDADVWEAAQREGRFLITQDLDFSDIRLFQPGTHNGLLLVRLREPGANALLNLIERVLRENALDTWASCVVILTEHKLRIKRP
jgi:predicted nuclease of predicted toxin-antitoxin system